MRQRVEGLIVGSLVGAALGIWVIVTMHAVLLMALAMGGVVGLSIFAVVATRPDPSDVAADAAWRSSAPDLPPVSDRVRLERAQEHIDGPSAKHRMPRRPSSAAAEKPAGASRPPISASEPPISASKPPIGA